MYPDTENGITREILDVLHFYGVEEIVLSPGSRNTPLLIGASAREEMRKRIIHDERTAGFVALGMALVSRRPVALACTSGTALYNYAPAVAEAYYQKIPLVVITADRPAQWIDQDDSQTLRQAGALDNIVKKSFDIYSETGESFPCGNPEFANEQEWYVNRIANEAMLTATGDRPGPVHINIQYANPLNGTKEYTPGRPRKVELIRNESGFPPHQLSALVTRLQDKKIMLVAGFMQPDSRLNSAVAAFAALSNVTVLCETISNLHLDGNPYMVDSLLSRLSEEDKRRMRPDVVITIGGALVSRMLKEYLRSCSGAEHWTLGDTAVNVDCLQRLAVHVDVPPRIFLNGVATALRRREKGNPTPSSTYNEEWRCTKEKAKEINTALITKARKERFTELVALDHVFRTLPREANVFLSNGTCVRYAQLLTRQLPHATYCNRGVSGIDGTNATALGAAFSYKGTTILITGDMSFAYCPEVLHLAHTGGDLRIILLNNNGGGIFRFIPTTRRLEIREEYFCAPPALPVDKIAPAYGWNYLPAYNMTELREGMDHLLNTPLTLLEVFCDASESAKTLIEFLTPQHNV